MYTKETKVKHFLCNCYFVFNRDDKHVDICDRRTCEIKITHASDGVVEYGSALRSTQSQRLIVSYIFALCNIGTDIARSIFVSPVEQQFLNFNTL